MFWQNLEDQLRVFIGDGSPVFGDDRLGVT